MHYITSLLLNSDATSDVPMQRETTSAVESRATLARARTVRQLVRGAYILLHCYMLHYLCTCIYLCVVL